jgi:hypothetical protein
MFRRKKWYYLILDEAHNIKNFKSKRWQIMLRFNAFRRLMLTGTPLQNNIIELWSLMHFLMPSLFASRREFTYWFNTPLVNSIENSQKVNASLLERLHEIIRPFILRRLKKDVAQQLPPKREHIVACKMSKRQAHLYEEFISRSQINTQLSSGNYIGMMNALMQLRKICNHPDLVEPRPVITPVTFGSLFYQVPKLIVNVLQTSIWKNVSGFYSYCWADDVHFHTSNCNGYPFNFDQHEFRISDGNAFTGKLGVFCEYLKSSRRSREQHCVARVSQNCRIFSNRLSLPFSKTFFGFASKPHRIQNEMSISCLHYFEENQHMLRNFVFVIPAVTAYPPSFYSNTVSSVYTHPFRLLPGYPSIASILTDLHHISLKQLLHYPEKKLVQYDCGKLQLLSRLLRNLKKDKHKCLIFTQMTRMLDILEIFLNLNHFSYVRLDGSTSVEDRQKLMDRFNIDEKIFCFILSTRSGGLGINLTGADTVIFYDTDWNPTVDAQAQDRAHRIGQSKEVNIYRLISESTLEENILLKAQQKRKLDTLVMNEGNFSETSLFSLNSLRTLFDDDKGKWENINEINQSNEITENLMNSVEDEEDQNAIKKFKSEIDTDLQEFNDDTEKEPLPASKIEEAEEKSEIFSILRSIDLYALRFFRLSDSWRGDAFFESSMEWMNSKDEVDTETGEAQVDLEDDVIVANINSNNSLLKSSFLALRRVYQRKRLLRNISGDCWRRTIVDSVPYWVNEDTGEYSFETPNIIKEREVYSNALLLKFNYLPELAMTSVFSYLAILPDRVMASRACARWRKFAFHRNFAMQVVPVERKNLIFLGANAGIFQSLREAVCSAEPGSTILLDNGHYWEKELKISVPLKVVCEELEDSTCFIEIIGSAEVVSTTSLFSAVHFRFQRNAGRFCCENSRLQASQSLVSHSSKFNSFLDAELHI